MEHAEIEQRQVVDLYLMGRLPAAEAAAFEEHLLDCPRCLDELELGERLLRGFKAVAAKEVTASAGLLAVLAALAGRFGGRGGLARPGRARWPAAVLTALLMVALLPGGLLLRRAHSLDQELHATRGELARRQSEDARARRSAGGLAAESSRLRGRLADGERQLGDAQRQLADQQRRLADLASRLQLAEQPRVNPPVLTLSPLRSAGPAAEPAVRVTLAAGDWLMLALDLSAAATASAADPATADPATAGPAGAAAPALRATLTRAGGAVVWRRGGLAPGAEGTVTLALPPRLLPGGDYQLALEAFAAHGAAFPVAHFSFRVTRR